MCWLQAGHATQLTDVALLPNGQSAQAVVQEQPQDEWEVDYQDIERGRRIGIGSFGEVFHCTWQMTDVAVKRLLDQDLCDQRMAVRFCPCEASGAAGWCQGCSAWQMTNVAPA